MPPYEAIEIDVEKIVPLGEKSYLPDFFVLERPRTYQKIRL